MTKTPYQWQPIRAGSTRLVTLLPAPSGTPIKIKIESVRLEQPVAPKPSQRLPLDELERTLPKGWIAAETHQYQYRVLFEDPDENTSWDHPDPRVDSALWAPLPEMPPPDYEPKFEALSYVCGPTGLQDPSVTIIVAGDDDQSSASESTIRVGYNLAVALRYLRYEDKPRRLWIDAISIDQHNAPERANQVRHISHVYRWARRVIVWLGPATETSHCAISTLTHIGNQLEISSDHRRYRSPRATEQDWFRSICTLSFPEPTWTAIEHLFQREWWERLWVWQETQLANSRAIVLCGFDQMEWQCLRKAIICLRTKDNLPDSSPGLRKRLELVEMMTIERSRCSLAMVLNSSRIRKCCDPRDKIYGILSIAGDVLSRSIKPDYGDSKSAADVYREVFKAYTSTTNRLDLLASCECSSGGRTPHLQSWVPDMSVARRTDSLLPFQLVSGVSGADAVFEEGTLRASGLLFDTIDQLYEPVPDDSDGVFKTLRDVYLTFENDGDSLNAFMRVVRAGYFDENWPGLSAPSLDDWRSQFQAAVLSGRKPYDETFNWCHRLVRGRRLFRVTGGLVGIGPLEARKDDFVQVLLGCKSPLVVRRKPSRGYGQSEMSRVAPGESEDRFEIIGECYVDGLENMSSLLGSLPDGWNFLFDKMKSGYGAIHTYLHKDGTKNKWHPSLEPLPQEWMPFERERRPEDPSTFTCFRNVKTGEEVNSDPRLTPARLRARGIDIRSFVFV